jgi:hypothetical protein
MTSHPRKVFVLGAGFTKAFLPQAPLLTDDYEVDFSDGQFDFRGALEWSCELVHAEASEHHTEGTGNESSKRD